MKTTLKFLLGALLATLLLATAPQGRAATISFQGSILGLSTPTNPELSTLDFYFVTAFSDQIVQIAHSVVGSPIGSGTRLHLTVYNYPLPGDDPDVLIQAGGTASGTVGTASFLAGHRYIVVFAPGDTDFDGYWPLPPVVNNDHVFNYFEYNSTMTGNVRLDAVWRGQADGTFNITIVPEPGCSTLLGAGLVLALACRRGKHRALAQAVLTVLAVGAANATPLSPDHDEVSQSQGTITWESLAGMGYKLRRSSNLEFTADWVRLPVDFVGQGGPMSYQAYDALTSPPPTGATLAQVLPLHSFYIDAYADDKALVRWNQGGEGLSAKIDFNSHRDAPNQTQRLPGGMPYLAPPTHLANAGYRMQAFVFIKNTNAPAVVPPLPLLPTQAERLAMLTAQLGSVRQALATPPAAVPPRVHSLFDSWGNPNREFFKLEKYLIDSDGDGYSDYTELLGTSNPANPLSLPLDADADGFSDAEEAANGYATDSAASHPPGGFITPYVGLQQPVITEFMAKNTHSLENTLPDQNDPTKPSHDDWIEIYNPTNATLPLDNWFMTSKKTTGGTITAANPTGNNTVARRTKWRFPAGASIPPKGFIIVMADNDGTYPVPAGSADRRGPDAKGYYHTNFGLGEGGEQVSMHHFTGDANNNGFIDLAELEYGWVCALNSEQDYAAQLEDTTLGCYVDAAGVLQFGRLRTPTPGRHNSEAYLQTLPAPVFSEPGGLRDTPGEGFDVTLSPPSADSVILYTTNGSEPTEWSEMTRGKTLTLHASTVISAMAVGAGWEKSPTVTRSFLFKSSILGSPPPVAAGQANHQGARDGGGQLKGMLRGYPEDTESPNYPMLYGMNEGVATAKRELLLAELSAAPVVSVVSSVADLFGIGTGGILPNSGNSDGGTDPRGLGWERPCSFEFFETAGGAALQANATIQVTGVSSLYQDTTRKHNMRVKFGAANGPVTFDQAVFPDLEVSHFHTFQLKNPTHDSWSNTVARGGAIDGSDAYTIGDVATYCNEAWMRATHRAMGHDAPRFRWVHLFLNGVYWGPEVLTERLDDDFMDSHAGPAEYDVMKQEGGVISGNATAYNQMIAAVLAVESAPAMDKAARFAELEALLDMDNYIDYIILNFYAQNDDWPNNNWRAARKRAGGKWQFFVWDAEWCLRPGEQTGHTVFPDLRPDLYQMLPMSAGAMEPHSHLLGYQGYKSRFRARILKHLFQNPDDPTSGSLAIVGGIDRAVARFQQEMARFQAVITCESARWGDMAKPVPYAQSDAGYLPGKPIGDWTRATAYTLNTWFPARHDYFLGVMSGEGLYHD